MGLTASILIPTRSRPDYLRVTLASLAGQARDLGAEVVVVDDAAEAATREVAERAGARYLALPAPAGANAARNLGLAESTAPLVIVVDDDIQARPGWLAAYLRAAAEQPLTEAFGGPIRPWLEGPAPRSCGCHGVPITSLDEGSEPGELRYAWSANMMARRSAFERLGSFDPSLADSGEEEEWQDRLRAAGGRIAYVPEAAVDHRRAGADARLRSLARAAFRRGRASRRYGLRSGPGPTLAAESLVLAGCLGHTVRRRCPTGLVLAAHSAGRLAEALDPRPIVPAEPFLSGHSGTVGGRRAVLRRAGDRALDLVEEASGRRRRLDRAAARSPQRRVLAIVLRRPEVLNTAERTQLELLRSRHRVEVVVADTGDAGKFENLNRVLEEHPAAEHDWLLAVDDDVELPARFLDRFLFLAERYGLALAQPAHTLASHAAWSLLRRRPLSAVRETSFVEIGPLTAFARETFPTLLPFPELRAGWGLDNHWAALARRRGWRLGVIDAVAVRHELRPVARHYANSAAVAEAREFLAGRPYLAREEIRTLAVHRGWR